MVDFIGLGAQKAGTSWVYACLYEHPEVCIPQKEIHFFSRDRYKKGQGWYESQFASCAVGCKHGEFSTSYLYEPGTAEKIARDYPDVKLIAIVRNPIDRAYSQYRNAIKAGEISKQTSFKQYLQHVPSAREQGLYAKQLARYFRYFSSLQLLVLVYEDSKEDPLAFIKSIYEHVEIDSEFVPKFLRQHVNVERTPRFVFIDRLMHRMAEGVRKMGLHKLVFWVKASGLPERVRNINTQPPPLQQAKMTDEERKELAAYFKKDVAALSSLLHRDMSAEWNIY